MEELTVRSQFVLTLLRTGLFEFYVAPGYPGYVRNTATKKTLAGPFDSLVYNPLIDSRAIVASSEGCSIFVLPSHPDAEN